MIDRAPPLRLAMVVQGLAQQGAVATCCLNQAKALANMFQVTVISDSQPDYLEGMGERIEVQQVHSLKFRLLRRYAHVPREFFFILSVGWSLFKQRRSKRFDCIVFHSHPATALLSSCLRRFMNCSTVMVMHGDIHDRPAGTYDQRLTAWYSLTTGRAYRVVDAIIALSPYMRNFAIAGGARRNKVFLAPNGVDASEIGLQTNQETNSESNDISKAPRRLLFIGRIEHNKGVDLLVQASAGLKSTYPDLQVICIGATTPSFQTTLLSEITSANLNSVFTFLAPLQRRELGAHYLAADIVVVPSRSETQSTVLLEAMAAGRAVVASDTGGNAMMVENGHTGLLFKPGDANSLRNALDQLLNNPNLLRAMSKAARQRHSEHYSRQHAASNLQRAFSDILHSRLQEQS